MFAFCQCLLSIELICRQITCDLYQQGKILKKNRKIKTRRGMMIFQLLLRVIQVVFVQE